MALVVSALAGAVLAGGVAAGASRAPGGPSSPVPRGTSDQYSRPPAETIRAEAQKVLSDPRFVHDKSFWEWLREWLSQWRGPRLGVPRGWGDFLAWLLVIWGVLTLLAILAHFVWTIVGLVRGRSGGRSGAGARQLHFHRATQASHDQLCREMAELARAGRFRQAVGVMMLAMLRWLESAGVVRFHPSKTNGDYLREFPSARPGREDFRRFVRAFDGTVYSQGPCTEGAFRRLNQMCGQVRDHVTGQP